MLLLPGLIGFCFVFIIMVPVWDLNLAESIVAAIIGTSIHFVSVMVIGWLVFLAVMAGMPVDGPLVFMIGTHLFLTGANIVYALSSHYHLVRARFLNAISSGWLAFLAIWTMFS